MNFSAQHRSFDIQAELHRIERKLHSFLDAAFRRELKETINIAIGYEESFDLQMDYADFIEFENKFHTWATIHAKDEASSPALGREYSDRALFRELDSQPSESNLEYVNQFLSLRFGLPLLSQTHVPNPRDWFVSADSYLRLAIENPSHFRRLSASRLNAVIGAGKVLEKFIGNLTFTNTADGLAFHTNLYDKLIEFNRDKTAAVLDQIRQVEDEYSLESPELLT